ncbi:MAG: 30S ribosomal protein S6 [bacterium]
MQREYETTFILDARLSPDKIDTKIKDIEKIIKENEGSISNVDRIGKRRLAYEINKNQYGYYVSYRFAIDGAKIIELRRRYSLEESIIRFLNIRIPKAVLEMEKKTKEKKIEAE